MATNTNAAPGPGGGRKIQIADWKPLSKNTLKGVFSATMPSGMVFHSLMLHERDDGKRWIGLPAKEWTNEQGVKQFSRFIEFTDRRSADRFRDEVLAALDAFLAGAQ